VETWPNLVGNEHWSMHLKYTTFNPLSPGFLLLLARLAAFLRREGLGADVQGFMRGSRAACRLVMLPRAFQYAGETFGDGYRFVGPALTGRAFQGDWQPPDDLPVVLVSLGTGYNDRPDFYRTVLKAAAGRPWRVVLASGQVDPADLGPVPPNVEVHRQVPQLAVLRHARAFVTHAGMGGTMEGLHFGVPLVAVPQMAEQRANADRIAELGLGAALPPDEVTAETLWQAVEDVSSDARVRERLDWMRGELEAAGGAEAAVDEIEKVLGP
jgi:MGT family glycosyltransferase